MSFNFSNGFVLGGTTGGGTEPVLASLTVTPSTTEQTLTPPSGTDGYNTVVASAVTAAIDADIVAGNIKKDVEILGVTGTYEGQQPSGTVTITQNGTTDVSSYATADVQVSGGGGSTDGEYFVCCIDYDGTVLKEEWLDTGDTFTLPTPPTHTGLVFDGWSCSDTITNNTITVTDNNVMVGALYYTASGAIEYIIDVTPVTGKSITLNILGGIDWGDGTAITSTASHTYTDYGTYTVKQYLASSSLTAPVNMGTNQPDQSGHIIKSIRFPKGTLSFSSQENINGLYFLESVAVHSDFKDCQMYNCYNLKGFVIPPSLDESAKIDGRNSLSISSCRPWQYLVIPKGVTKIYEYGIGGGFALVKTTIPDTVTSMGTQAFAANVSYKKVLTIPSGITSIGDYVFSQNINVEKVVVKGNLTSIGSGAFQLMYNCKEYDFTHCTSVPTMSNTAMGGTSNGINSRCVIKVPASLEASWKTATNWATYADYIVGV